MSNNVGQPQPAMAKFTSVRIFVPGLEHDDPVYVAGENIIAVNSSPGCMVVRVKGSEEGGYVDYTGFPFILEVAPPSSIVIPRGPVPPPLKLA